MIHLYIQALEPPLQNACGAHKDKKINKYLISTISFSPKMVL